MACQPGLDNTPTYESLTAKGKDHHMKNNGTSNWRAEFRLHTMDMLRPAPAQRPVTHWMLQDDTIREWIGHVAIEYEKLIAAGGDPFAGEPVTLERVIDELGFAHRKKPSGWFATAKFTAALVVATTRHATAAQRASLRLRRSRFAAA